jgi:putative SOS response-associated peptidase YedK
MILGLVSIKEAITKRFEASIPEKVEYSTNYNIRPGYETLLLSSANIQYFSVYRYGMVPSWSKEERIIYEAPIEGDKLSQEKDASQKGIVSSENFRKPIRAQRGIVPADYFVVENNEGKPYIIYSRDKKRPLALGCVWDAWKMNILDDLIYGYAILTLPATGEFAKLGIKRLPLILPEFNYKRWLKADAPLTEIISMLEIFPEKFLNAHLIGQDIINSTENDQSLIIPVGEPVVKQEKREGIHLPRIL